MNNTVVFGHDFDRSESPPIFGPAREQLGGMFQKLQVLIDGFLNAGA